MRQNGSINLTLKTDSITRAIIVPLNFIINQDNVLKFILA